MECHAYGESPFMAFAVTPGAFVNVMYDLNKRHFSLVEDALPQKIDVRIHASQSRASKFIMMELDG
jgi:hypothetical protein